MSATGNGAGQSAIDLAAVLRRALEHALVALALGFPVVAYLTEQNAQNQLILSPRFGLLLALAGAAFALVLVKDLLWPLLRRIPFLRLHLTPGNAGEAIGGMLGGTAGTVAARIGRLLATGKLAPRAGVVLIALYPLIALTLAGTSGAIKWIDNFGVQILIYVMLGWGLNIVVGLAGLLDLGYVAFYAVGAYTYGLLATSAPLKATFAAWIGPNFWPLWAFWICLPVAGILAAFWGILLGFPVLRLRGDYLAIVTLAFGEIIRLVLINWVDLTNGYAGVSSIPRPSFFGLPFNATPDGFAAKLGLPQSPLYRIVFLYYLILGLALLTNIVARRMRRLPIGRAWEALREDEIASRALGINSTTTKLTAFALGAMFAGFAGSFFAARQGFISPESFTFMESAIILAIVVLGGMGSQVGVAIAAVALIGGTELLREIDWLKGIFGNDFDPAQYRMLLFGLAMVGLMIWRPRGLVGTREPTVFLNERKAISADLVREGHG